MLSLVRSTKITLPLKWQLKSSGHQIIIEAGETGLFRAAVNFVCVCVSGRERHIRDVRGHSSISNLTDRHTALTRCLSARGASVRDGA